MVLAITYAVEVVPRTSRGVISLTFHRTRALMVPPGGGMTVGVNVRTSFEGGHSRARHHHVRRHRRHYRDVDGPVEPLPGPPASPDGVLAG